MYVCAFAYVGGAGKKEATWPAPTWVVSESTDRLPSI